MGNQQESLSTSIAKVFSISVTGAALFESMNAMDVSDPDAFKIWVVYVPAIIFLAGIISGLTAIGIRRHRAISQSNSN